MLPIFQTMMPDLNMLQTRWASLINPLVACPLTKGLQLSSVVLVSGANSINHKLARKLQGWIIVGIDGVASIYDTQATNSMPDRTLNLVSNAAVTVNLWVY